MESGRVVRFTAAAGIVAFALAAGSSGVSGQQPQQAAAPPPGGRIQGAGLVQSLTETGQGLTIRTAAPRSGLVRFASSTGSGILLPLPPGAPASERALSFIDGYGRPFGLQGRSQVRVEREPERDQLGFDHVRLQQVHLGIPVRAGEMIVHLRGNRVMAANGRVTDRFPESTQPFVAAQDAIDASRELMEKRFPEKASGLEYREPQLEILDRGLLDAGDYPVLLTWFVEVSGPDVRQFVWVDARRGVVAFAFSQLTHAKYRTVYTMNHATSPLPGALVRSEGQAATGDLDADNAYAYAGATYDYYFTQHGRDSYDNAGGELRSSVHFGSDYQNAYWNGSLSQMVYGDGFSSADDVVAHELTHAVTERTANLLYYNQSGALNESFSDIFGEAVDLVDGLGDDSAGSRWLLGEDLPPSIGAIRNMMSPNDFQQPAKMVDVYFYCNQNGWTDPYGDSGGVHINSGVPNHAFALMVDGGTYNGYTITGIGLTKAGKIEYRALTTYLTSGSGFSDAYLAVSQSCTDLVGTAGITTADCTEVLEAQQAVEMDHVYACSGYTPAPALCPAGTPTNVFYDGFESVSGWWTAEVVPLNDNFFGRTTGFAKSGAWSAYGTDGTANYEDVSDHRYFTSSAIAIPTGGKLYFDHAFEFESYGTSFYDGGIVEYSSDGGTTWTQVGATLIEAGQSYNGVVPAGWGNPLAGLSAFGGSSYGYTGTRVNLSSLAGQSVRFRFRIGTDNIGGSLGWVIDNVRVYSCTGASLPDLTPYQPASWNDRIPVGIVQVAGTATHDYAGPYYDTQVLYYNWASMNQGAAVAGPYRIHVEVAGTGGATTDWDVPDGVVGNYWYLSNDQAVGPLSAGTHTFRVWVDYLGAVDESNEANNYYERTITVTAAATPPGAFNKTSPANGATGQLTSPTLTWGASTGATSYEYCYDTTNDSACSTWTSNGTSTSKALSGLTPGTTYYWHVRATNASGTTYANGSTTAFWSFTVQAVPGAFNKTSPANGATGQSTSPTLTWGASTGATSYEYCYDTTNDNACTTWTGAGTNTSASLSGLATNTAYYWHVRATNASGTTYANGSSTAFWSFTTSGTRIIALSGNLAFGEVTVGTTATRTLTIGNSGTSTLTVTGITYPAGFSGAWSGDIAPGGSQPVTVTFAPIAVTSYGGTVTVDSNKTSGTNTISASGTGVPVPTYTVSGHVRTLGGGGVPGVAMSGLPGTITTDSEGYYTATVNSGWSGTVTPARKGWAFNPASVTYSNVTASQIGDYVETVSGNAVYAPPLHVPACLAGGTGCDSGPLLAGRGLLSLGPEPNQPNTLGGSCGDGQQGSYQVDESIERIRVSPVDGTSLVAGGLAVVDVTAWTFSPEDVLDIFFAADANAPVWVTVASLPVAGPGNHVFSTLAVLPGGGLQAVRAQLRFRGEAASCTVGDLDDHDDLAFSVIGADVSVEPTNLVWGTTGSVPVMLQALGTERVVSFSVTFDPATLAFQQAVLGSGAPVASLQVDSSQGGSGRVGLVVSMPSGQAFAAGRHEIVVLHFAAPGGSGIAQTTVALGDVPRPRGVESVSGTPLPAAWHGAQVVVSGIRVTGVSPDRGGTPGDETVTITGAGFIAGQTSVLFGGVPSRAVAVTSPTTLTAVTPPGVAGPVDVSAVVPGATGTLPGAFTYELPGEADGPDLRMTISHAGSFAVGMPGVYTLIVTNAGGDATTGEIVVVDTLPAGLSYVSHSGTGWTCAAEGAYVGCRHAGPLAARSTLEPLRISVSVTAGAVPSVTNRARAWTAGESRGWDNEASDVTDVAGPPAPAAPPDSNGHSIFTSTRASSVEAP